MNFSNFKGFNSVLFDIDSLIDKELSSILYLQKTGRYNNALDIKKLEFMRMFSATSIFDNISIKGIDNKSVSIFYASNERDIFDKECFYFTIIKRLLTAYATAGNGVIETSVRCDNEIQAEFLKNKFPNTNFFVSIREDTDTSKYGRIVVGHCDSALKYNFNEPKSIVVLNFRENFSKDDITLLKHELIISLGDVNKIEIAPAYDFDPDIKG